MPASTHPNDIESQATNNYDYDAIGNLTKDGTDVSAVFWTPANKIDSIVISSRKIAYLYDAMGNRIRARAWSSSNVFEKTTWYLRDPQGNVLSIYTKAGVGAIHQTEIPIIGSDRIGMIKPNRTWTNDWVDTIDVVEHRYAGQRSYELKDHLGNIRVVVSDEVTKTTNNEYLPVVLAQTDYYPFGMIMESRSDGTAGYRYGFSGQEKDDEVVGSGNHYTAQFWEMDPRLGRRWERDPVVKRHESPYAIMGNNPIWFVDLNGADSSLYNSSTGAIIAMDISPEDDKTAIWTVDPAAKGYDNNNPWATAQKLTYTVGEKQGYHVGEKHLRDDHPLVITGWTYGAQVYAEDLLDITSEFNDVVYQWKPAFANAGKVWDESAYRMLDIWSPGPIANALAMSGKALVFAGLVGPDRAFDLKSQSRVNLQQISSYAAVVIGQYSFCQGMLMSYDDYGNIAYGRGVGLTVTVSAH